MPTTPLPHNQPPRSSTSPRRPRRANEILPRARARRHAQVPFLATPHQNDRAAGLRTRGGVGSACAGTAGDDPDRGAGAWVVRGDDVVRGVLDG